MFGGQKKQEEIKRLEKEVLSRQAKLDRYAKTCSEIAARQRESEHQMERLESSRFGMDQQLTRVIDAVNHAADETSRQKEEEQSLQEQTRKLAENLEQSESDYWQQIKELKQQNDEMIDIVEQNKHFTAPAKFLSQITAELGGALSKVSERLEELDNLGCQMGVVSLNAAIEAGRMGESGTQFVAAAEDVRDMAGQYQQLTDSFSQVVEHINKRLKETEEQVMHLNSLLKENNVCMGKTTKEFTDTLYEMEHSDGQKLTPQVKGILERMEGTAESKKELDRQYSLAAEAMELAGESFMKQQESLDKMKEDLGEIHDQIKNV